MLVSNQSAHSALTQTVSERIFPGVADRCDHQLTYTKDWKDTARSLNNTRHPSLQPPPPPNHHITKVNQQWFPQYQETLLSTYNWLVSFLGVLFSKATHYLPLNFTREDKTKLVDMRGNATGMVFNTINASTAEQIGQVLRLNGIDNYIELNNLKDECITNPSKCTEGLSVAFWIKYTEGK